MEGCVNAVCGGAHTGPILPPAMREGERFAATMCNPPFFERLEEAGRNPATAFSGTAAEMVCPGGEAAFVLRMLRDSLALRVRAPLPSCCCSWRACSLPAEASGGAHRFCGEVCSLQNSCGPQMPRLQRSSSCNIGAPVSLRK